MQKFDEMYTSLPYQFFSKGEQVRDHYKIYDAWLARQPGDMMAKRREEAEMIFRRVGITFAVYGEEFGLIGNLILLALYFALIVRGMMIAYGAGNLFGRLVAGALTLTLFTYAFVNMGMVSGILPVVGVPLPFVSYGGTALVTILISLGILMGINSQKKLVQT